MGDKVHTRVSILTNPRPHAIISVETSIGVAMLIGLIHVNARQGKATACRVCKLPIEPGDLHAMVVTRWGKAQAAAHRLAAASGKVTTKKTGLKYRRLHIGECLCSWLVTVRVAKAEYRRERKGRPIGSGQLPPMPTDDRAARRKLVRRRAEALRQIDATEEPSRLEVLVKRFADIEKQLAVPVSGEMARRDQRTISRLNEKIKRYI